MAVVITHSTPADGTFSATGAAAWNANHTLSGIGTMAEQNANSVSITGGTISGITGLAASGANSDITSLSGLTTPLSVAQGGSGTATPSLVAGTNVTISGTWPNQTINSTGGTTSLAVNSTPTSGGAAGQLMYDTGSVLTESSKLTFAGDTLNAPSLKLQQNISAAAWTTNGIKIVGGAATLTDTSSSGTVANAYTNVLGGNTIAASNSTTFTNYASVFVNTPTAGSNVTITNSYSLIAAGAIKAPTYAFNDGTTQSTAYTASAQAFANLCLTGF